MCREEKYREMLYRVYRALYTEETALNGVKFLYTMGRFSPVLLLKKVFDNCRCRYAFRASEPAEGGHMRISEKRGMKKEMKIVKSALSTVH